MVKLKPGDKVNCLLKNNTIVSSYSDFDQEITFEIVALNDKGYFLYIPPYLYIRGSYLLTEPVARRMDVNKKFIDIQVVHIIPDMICKVHSILDGCQCVNCEEFFEQAAPNQEDLSFVCFLCRTYVYR